MADGIARLLEGGLELLSATSPIITHPSVNFSQYSFFPCFSTFQQFRADNFHDSTRTAGSSGGLLRLDISLFANCYDYAQLSSMLKDDVTATVIVSSVDSDRVSESSIRALVREQFPADKQREILRLLLEAALPDAW